MSRTSALRLVVWLFGAAAVAILLAASGGQSGGGALDPTFGRGGIVLTALGFENAGARDVALEPDGRIVAAGSAMPAPREAEDFALARYTTGGKLDPSFGRGGKVLTDLGADDHIVAVAVQADGKIVAAGSGGELVRYTTGGRLDRSFGAGGRVIDRSTSSFYTGVALQKDGKIVVVGWSDRRDFALTRYTAGGKVDTTFGRHGKVLTDLGTTSEDYAEAVAVQADGKIVAAGFSGGYPGNRFAVVRYTTSGKLDASFGRSGKVLTDVRHGDDTEAASLVLQADGKIVVGGSVGYQDSHDFALARYTTDGKLDASFGTGGKVLTNVARGVEHCNAVAVQPDGKIVAAGASGPGFALVRYTSRGKLDTTFGAAGRVLSGPGGAWASSVAIQKDGKIVAAGSTGSAFAVVRYTK